MKKELQERLDKEYAAYRDSLAGMPPENLMDMAYEIAATEFAYRHIGGVLLDYYEDSLSQFQQPLALVRDILLEEEMGDRTEDLDHALWQIFDKEADFYEEYGRADAAENAAPEKPKMELIGHDGNVFSILGRASGLLKRAGLAEQAKEMRERVFASGNYDQALSIISEYVQTELSIPEMPKHTLNKPKPKVRKVHER